MRPVSKYSVIRPFNHCFASASAVGRILEGVESVSVYAKDALTAPAWFGTSYFCAYIEASIYGRPQKLQPEFCELTHRAVTAWGQVVTDWANRSVRRTGPGKPPRRRRRRAAQRRFMQNNKSLGVSRFGRTIPSYLSMIGMLDSELRRVGISIGLRVMLVTQAPGRDAAYYSDRVRAAGHGVGVGCY
jgi:hypothetical protein